MSLTRDRLEHNLRHVNDRIAQAARRVRRSPDSVRLVAVTKAVGVEEIEILYSLGLRHFSENRVENFREKKASIPSDVCWHMIGRVQGRKARAVAEEFDRVDSVDRIEIADRLDHAASEAGGRLPVLVQFNVSGESAKQGFEADAASEVISALSQYEHLELLGVMTMAPLVSDPEIARPVFSALHRIARDAALETISMGMTNDFEIAIEEGATEVRIGSALFA